MIASQDANLIFRKKKLKEISLLIIFQMQETFSFSNIIPGNMYNAGMIELQKKNLKTLANDSSISRYFFVFQDL